MGFNALVTVGPEFYGTCLGAKPFPSLEILKFIVMSSWKRWSSEDCPAFAVLKKLNIFSCPKLTGDLPRSFPSLTKLNISCCEKLASSLPRMACVLELEFRACENMMQVEPFFEALRQMESCQRISLVSCSSPIPIPVGCLPTHLKFLGITLCSGLEFQFDRPHKSLEALTIMGSCNTLVTLPLNHFPNLKKLDIEVLENLESLSMLDGLCKDMTSLSSLHISECPSFVYFPKDGLHAPNLTNLTTNDCKKLKYSKCISSSQHGNIWKF